MEMMLWNALLTTLLGLLGWNLKEKSAELVRITILLNRTREEIARDNVTQAEIDKLEANGTDVKQFIAERAKAHRAKQQKLAAFFVQGLMTRSLLKEARTKLAKYEQDEEAEDSEFEAIQKTTKKKAAPSEKEVRPKDRPSAITKLFPDSDD